jgi:hypothetical protein
VRLRMVHWLCASLNSVFPVWPPRRLMSSRLVLVAVLRLSRPLGGSVGLSPGPSGESVTRLHSRCDRTGVGWIAFVLAE